MGITMKLSSTRWQQLPETSVEDLHVFLHFLQELSVLCSTKQVQATCGVSELKLAEYYTL